MSLNDVIEIGECNPQYISGIDGYLREHDHRRFFVSSRRRAKVSFKQLALELSSLKLKHGTSMFLGYEHLHRLMREYFLFGANPNIPSSDHYSIMETGDYSKAVEKILERDNTDDRHDCAYLFSPDGVLFHAGAYFDTKSRIVLKAHGYSSLYEFKKDKGIKGKGGTRILTALIHSMIFINAGIVSISGEGSSTPNYFMQNGILRPF